MANRKGRPRKSGQRKACGRLKQRATAVDYGSEKVQAITALHTKLDPKLRNDVGCCIGKAHAWGLLEGYGCDPEAMRDAAREFAQIRPRYLSDTAMRTAAYDRRSRGKAEVVGYNVQTATPLERRYHQFMKAISSCSLVERDAFFSFATDYFDRDHELAPFVLRLINARRADQKLPPINYDGSIGSGPMPNRADKERMDRAASVMVAMVAGQQQRRVA